MLATVFKELFYSDKPESFYKNTKYKKMKINTKSNLKFVLGIRIQTFLYLFFSLDSVLVFSSCNTKRLTVCALLKNYWTI